MKIKKGDTVQISTGKSRGKTGQVEKALPKEGKVVISGVNLVKKHQRARDQRHPGGIIEMPAAIDVSNVMLVCPKCKLKTRVGYKVGGGVKGRVCKQCDQIVDA